MMEYIWEKLNLLKNKFKFIKIKIKTKIYTLYCEQYENKLKVTQTKGGTKYRNEWTLV